MACFNFILGQILTGKFINHMHLIKLFGVFLCYFTFDY